MGRSRRAVSNEDNGRDDDDGPTMETIVIGVKYLRLRSGGAKTEGELERSTWLHRALLGRAERLDSAAVFSPTS